MKTIQEYTSEDTFANANVESFNVKIKLFRTTRDVANNVFKIICNPRKINLTQNYPFVFIAPEKRRVFIPSICDSFVQIRHMFFKLLIISEKKIKKTRDFFLVGKSDFL
ncbi:MAG: hypothetical protein LBH92_07475 [Bacteroidales bacterium]|jgi:hypothetical protein|nr:hypothetical protein [Bacteroidales bacterium]